MFQALQDFRGVGVVLVNSSYARVRAGVCFKVLRVVWCDRGVSGKQ